MKKDMQISINPAMLVAFFKRYHLVLFIVLTVFILSAAILLLYGIVEKASGTDAEITGTPTSNFDKATIQRINELKTSDQPSTPLDMSAGRINPFSE